LGAHYPSLFHIQTLAMVYYRRLDISRTQEKGSMPSTTRREVPHAGSELETLDALLQYCQETLLVKMDGLSEDDLRRPQVYSHRL